jgi:putative lipoic acid-binding regulatory protein
MKQVCLAGYSTQPGCGSRKIKTQTMKKSIIDFPTSFPIKVMGKNVPHFSQVICDLLMSLNPQFDIAQVEMRPSSKGNYLSLTCTVFVNNQEELDTIYRALSGHELVSVVL